MSQVKVGDKGWTANMHPTKCVRVDQDGSSVKVWYRDDKGGMVWSGVEDWNSRLLTRPLAASTTPEYTGGSVDYYKVEVKNPTTASEPYMAECNDIIEALGMNYAEGNAFKALWRRAAHRTLGKKKAGAKDDGLYDAEKVAFFGQRLVEQSKVAK